MENKFWFNDSFRRNLVDMHIEDWDPKFLSEFSPEEYYKNLKRANIRSAMIYLHSHVGYSYYPTRTGKMHSSFKGREDSIRRLIDMCRANGIDVIGYYSLIFNTFEEDRHPEWKIVDRNDGSSERERGSRYGHCCPNNPEYRAYIEEQIKEISEYFTVDGMFYDMTFWPGSCRCEHCKARYMLEEGRDIPTSEDPADPEYFPFIKKRYEWIGEFAQYVTALSRKYMPHASVEHNYAHGVAGNWHQAVTERTNDACDYCGGDPGRDKFEQSFTLKYYRAVTKNPPFEYMIYRCIPNLAQHTVTKPADQLELEVFMTAAHHGAAFIIDAMDPVGTLNPKVYSLVGDIFKKLIPYESHMMDGEPIADAAIYYSSSGRYSTKGESHHSMSCASNLCKTLIMNNVPVDIVTNSHESIDRKYKLLFAPDIAGIEVSDREKILDYVRNGGLFYISGTEEKELIRELVGVEFDSFTPVSKTYYAPAEEHIDFLGEDYDRKYPFPVDVKLPLTRLTKDVDVIAHLTLPYIDENDPSRYSSIHSNPPAEPTEYPQMVSARYGKGRVIWSAAPIENDGRIMYQRVMMKILREFLPIEGQSVVSDAQYSVEICSYRYKGGYQISCVNLGASEEMIAARDFSIGILMGEDEAKRIGFVGDALSEESIEHWYENGRLCFKVSGLTMFKMIEIR